MKTSAFILSVIAVGLMESCSGKSESMTENAIPATETVEIAEEMPDPAIATQLIQYSDSATYNPSTAYVDFEVETPTGNREVSDSVKLWIASVFGSDRSYETPDDLRQILKSRSDSFITDALDDFRMMYADGMSDDLWQGLYEYETKILKTYESENAVTFSCSTYVYTGGAHGMPAFWAYTFSKSDGRRLGWNMVRPMMKQKLVELVKKKIMTEYFETTEAEFQDYLLVNESEFPLPTTDPFLAVNGLHFLYQRYEIAPYAAGLPECTLPLEEIKPILTDAAKAVIM